MTRLIPAGSRERAATVTAAPPISTEHVIEYIFEENNKGDLDRDYFLCSCGAKFPAQSGGATRAYRHEEEGTAIVLAHEQFAVSVDPDGRRRIVPRVRRRMGKKGNK